MLQLKYNPSVTYEFDKYFSENGVIITLLDSTDPLPPNDYIRKFTLINQFSYTNGNRLGWHLNHHLHKEYSS